MRARSARDRADSLRAELINLYMTPGGVDSERMSTLHAELTALLPELRLIAPIPLGPRGPRDPRGPQPKVKCPHCGTTGGKNVMFRWHFENCRART